MTMKTKHAGFMVSSAVALMMFVFSCGAIASSITGAWTVYEQSPSGMSIAHWDISIVAGALNIVDFQKTVPGAPGIVLPGDYRKRLRVSNAAFDGRQLTFTTQDYPVEGVTTHYILNVTGPNSMEGHFRLSDSFLGGMLGTREEAGKVVLKREH